MFPPFETSIVFDSSRRFPAVVNARSAAAQSRWTKRERASYAGTRREGRHDNQMEQTDEQLVLACRRGEEVAWEMLVNRYQRLIFAIPRRAGLDEDTAAEVFQDVFTTLMENIESIEQPSRLHAWLVTTAKRKTWRVVRRNSPLRSLSGAGEDGERDEAYDIPDAQMLPDAALQQLEEQHLVRAALADLDERCAKLLTMLFYAAETPPYSEIAAALGTSEGSIGPTRARCLKKLLDVLQRKGFRAR